MGTGGPRTLRSRVKTAKGRKLSSTLWLDRQLNDPYVAKAKAAGYRSRAAFKLAQIDDKFRVIKRGARVLDLGAAPGGWLQVARERGCGVAVGVDLLPVDPIPGATLLEMDATAPEAQPIMAKALGGPADLVMSDMAAATTGVKSVDQDRTLALAEWALDIAEAVLAKQGSFVCKVFRGGADDALLRRLKASFAQVKHVKPEASRPESPELYLVALRFQGRVAT